MALPFNLSEELEVWAQKYGKETRGTWGSVYHKIEYQDGVRIKFLTELLTRLQELGAKKDYFRTVSIRNQIIEKCVGPTYVVRGAKRRFVIGKTANDLDAAIIKVYGTDSSYFEKNGKARKRATIKKCDEPSIEELARQEDLKSSLEEELKEVILEQSKPEVIKEEIKEYVPGSNPDLIEKEEEILDPEMVKLMNE
jgi:hypothetical protein